MVENSPFKVFPSLIKRDTIQELKKREEAALLYYTGNSLIKLINTCVNPRIPI